MHGRQLVASAPSWSCSGFSGSTPAPATDSERRCLYAITRGGSDVSTIEIAAFIVSVALMFFLFYAMLRPEKL